MELGKNHPEWGIPDSERQIWYAFTYMWKVAVKSMMTKLQFIESHVTGIEKRTIKVQRDFVRKGNWNS